MLLYNSKIISFVIQVIAGIIGIYALLQKIPPQIIPLKQSLLIEMFVQIIQMSIYTWLMFSFYIPTMSLIRYIDWFLTTPLMLISLMLYFNYANNIENNLNTVNENENENENNLSITPIFNFIKNNKEVIQIVLISNAFMLFFGLIGELKYISKYLAIILGFISLIISLYLIYNKFVLTNKAIYIFIPFSIIWSLYGVAYMFNEIPKNIMYNFLDIIAKNFFGIFLSITLINETKKIKTN
jgi:bacteriorhodopsin